MPGCGSKKGGGRIEGTVIRRGREEREDKKAKEKRGRGAAERLEKVEMGRKRGRGAG